MNFLKRQPFVRDFCCAAGVAILASSSFLGAQVCTTQSRMDASTRNGLRDAAQTVGNAVKAGDTATVKANSATDLAANFGATENLIHATADKLTGDTMQVVQLYLLDASAPKPNDSGNADFTCPLKDEPGAETDFSISGLPRGTYGFAMVEATGGAHPWLLSMLLEKQGTAWKMAGFYPKARTAGGHDGLWFWKTAREQASAKHALLSWLYYDEASALLQPAPFVSSSNLDKLRGEQRDAGTSDLANGISAGSPYVVHGENRTDYKFNSLVTESTDDGTGLRLMIHVVEEPTAGADDIRAHSEAAARALMQAHPELKPVYRTVFVFADGPQGNPPVVTLAASQLQ